MTRSYAAAMAVPPPVLATVLAFSAGKSTAEAYEPRVVVADALGGRGHERIAISDLVRPATFSSSSRASGNRWRIIVLSSNRASCTARIAADRPSIRAKKPWPRLISQRARQASGAQWTKAAERCGSIGNQKYG